MMMFVNRVKINPTTFKSGTTDVSISIPFSMDYQIVDQAELIETEFVKIETEAAINPILDYDRVRFLPLDLNNNHIDKVTYDIKLFDANGQYTGNYAGIGFTDDDIKLGKHNFKQTFLDLNFYDTDNRLTQKLVTYITLFSTLNTSDYLPLSGTSGIPGQPKPANQIPINFIVENPLLNPKGVSEGYHLYDYKDNLKVGEFKYLYMRASVKNAKTGKEVNLMVGNTPEPIDKLVHELYTRYKLIRTTSGYYYEIDNTYKGNTTSTNNVTYNGNVVNVMLYEIKAI